jgi:hypothetical protein
MSTIATVTRLPAAAAAEERAECAFTDALTVAIPAAEVDRDLPHTLAAEGRASSPG